MDRESAETRRDKARQGETRRDKEKKEKQRKKKKKTRRNVSNLAVNVALMMMIRGPGEEDQEKRKTARETTKRKEQHFHIVSAPC